MAENVITTVGFLKSSDVRSKQEFGFKFKTIGARISESDTASASGLLVYNNPGPEPNITEMKRLTAFTGGTEFPVDPDEFIPVRSAVPVAGTDENPDFSMVYEFIIDPEEIGSPFNIREIGLFAQQFVQTRAWDPAVNYFVDLDYVTHNGKTWRSATSIVGITVIWDALVTFEIGDRVQHIGRFWTASVQSIGEAPQSGSSFWDEDLNHQPSDSSTSWTKVSETQDNLFAFGQPFLLDILIRREALPQNDENATRLTITIAFDKEVAQVIFDESDTTAFTELQLLQLEIITTANRSIRDLASDIQVINDATGDPLGTGS